MEKKESCGDSAELNRVLDQITTKYAGADNLFKSLSAEELGELIAAMAKFEMKLEAPIKYKTDDPSNVVLIRHGMSEFNYQAEVIIAQDYGWESQEMKAINVDPKIIDPEMHTIGAL